MAWIATEMMVALFTRTRHDEGEVQDRGSLMVLWVVIFGAMFVGIVGGRDVSAGEVSRRDTGSRMYALGCWRWGW